MLSLNIDHVNLNMPATNADAVSRQTMAQCDKRWRNATKGVAMPQMMWRAIYGRSVNRLTLSSPFVAVWC